MSLTLPIPEFVAKHRRPQRPGSKAFVVPVLWEATPAVATSVPLLINPAMHVQTHRVKTVTRLRIPLELRLDPTL